MRLAKGKGMAVGVSFAAAGRESEFCSISNFQLARTAVTINKYQS